MAPTVSPGGDPFADLAPILVATTTRSEFDEFGFAGVVRTRLGSEQTTVRRTFDHMSGPLWRVGFLAESRVSSSVSPSLERRCDRSIVTTYDNDLSGARVRSVTRDLGDPSTQQTTRYRYGAFGNVEAIVTTTVADGSRTVDLQWSDDGYFPIGMRNTLAHQTRVAFEPWFGTVRASVDPNAIESRHRIDGFGRPRIDDDDTGARTEIRYFRTTALGRTRVEMTSTSEGHAAVELDRLRRAVTTEEFHARVHTSTEVTYDTRGRVSQRTEPHAVGTVATAVTSWFYDPLDRVRLVSGPEPGERERYRYERLTTIRRDALRNEWRTVLDESGNPALVREPSGGGDTTYSYCVGGELASVRDAEGNVTQVFYDRLGRRTRLEDPDTGRQTIEYNAWDEVVRTIDAEGRVSRFEHDVLGRLTDRFDDADGSHFHWDFDGARAPSGRVLLGLLERASSGDGVVDESEYDDLARPVAMHRTINGRSLFASVTYDDQGRIATSTAPSAASGFALTLHYTYDADDETHGSGEVVGIDGTVPGLDSRRAPIWRLERQDVHGGPSRERLGNAATSSGEVAHWADRALRRSTTYTPAGRIRSIVTGRPLPALEVWQQLEYTYDARGLLETRHRFTGGSLTALESEQYVHDALGRLSSVVRNSVSAERYGYDLIGNLEETHDATLTYAELGSRGGPHAVSTFSGDRGDTWSVSYNAVGNAVEVGEQVIDYNQFNLPIRVTGSPDGGVASASYAYDASGGRARKTGVTGETLYFGGYELELDGRSFRERTAIATPYGVIAQFEVGYDGNAATHRIRWLLTDAEGTVETSGLPAGTPTHHAYDAFGAVRDAAGAATTDAPSGDVNHGYTGHEHEGDVGLLNMGLS